MKFTLDTLSPRYSWSIARAPDEDCLETIATHVFLTLFYGVVSASLIRTKTKEKHACENDEEKILHGLSQSSHLGCFRTRYLRRSSSITFKIKLKSILFDKFSLFDNKMLIIRINKNSWLIKTIFERITVFILTYTRDIISIVPRDQDHLSEFDNYCDTRISFYR